MAKYFGTDGIRGEVEKVVNFKLARNLGMALVKYRPNAKVVVATDTRPSAVVLKQGLFLGLVNGGAEVVDVGVCPTAGVSFLTEVLNADFGVMITASHNPPLYNGLKVFNKNGEKLSAAEAEAIERLMEEEFELNYFSTGVVKTRFQLVELYIEYLENAIDVSLEGLKIVLDCANGAGVVVAKKVFEDLGAEVKQIGGSTNGVYINDGFGALHPELLCEEVKNSNANLGLAFDGDADRLIVVTSGGNILNGDQTLFILANYLKNQGKLNKNSVVVTLETNQGIIIALKNLGVNCEVVSVGDHFVVEKMAEKGIGLGGERSGHIILGDFAKTADGILAGVILSSIVKQTGKSLNTLSCKSLRKFAERNYKTCKADFILKHKEVGEVINFVSTSLGDLGRVLVRKSGTEDVVRVLVESESLALANCYADQILTCIKTADKK